MKACLTDRTSRLLSLKHQENYYQKITHRYMQFCTKHAKNLDEAFMSLSISDEQTPASRDSAAVIAQLSETRPITPAHNVRSGNMQDTGNRAGMANETAKELSVILTALRKLREGILATSHTVASPLFSQRVHIFNIRLAILALQPEHYHASLRYLLGKLHSQDCPLPRSELTEMTSFLILDTALRLGDIIEAYAIRSRARTAFKYANRYVDQILQAVVHQDWPLFWRIRTRVDGYMRAIMHYHLESIRKTTLKTIGKSYLKCDIKWIIQSTTGGEMDWDELVVREDIGWLRDGDNAIVRKPKVKN